MESKKENAEEYQTVNQTFVFIYSSFYYQKPNINSIHQKVQTEYQIPTFDWNLLDIFSYSILLFFLWYRSPNANIARQML